jgi:hypothetical protein
MPEKTVLPSMVVVVPQPLCAAPVNPLGAGMVAEVIDMPPCDAPFCHAPKLIADIIIATLSSTTTKNAATRLNALR